MVLSHHKRTAGRTRPGDSFRETGWAWLLMLALVCAVGVPPAWSQEPVPSHNGEADLGRIEQTLLILSGQIQLIQKELNALQKLPPSPALNQQKMDLLKQLDDLNRNFEALATQQELSGGDLAGEKKSDWARELEALTLPMLEALSDLTKKPRRIEQLHKRIETLEHQKLRFEKAHDSVAGLLQRHRLEKPAQTETAQLYLDQLNRLDARFNPELIQLRLEEARKTLDEELKNTESVWETLSKALKNFFKHRGFNLLVTVSLFIVLWLLLSKVRVFILGPKSFFSVPTWMRKVLATAYSILVLIVCIISSLVTLYLMNDWLLLSVIVLFLAAVAWASRQFIPRLFKEVRLALNLGTVRENERLIWRGVPWEVKSIGLQAALGNELLEGGTVYLPVGELIGQYSRPASPEEPWFPTRQGDWVLLADGTYGQVEIQTVEQVILKLKGDTRKFFQTTAFLAQVPMNLSRGFRYDLAFALDYSLQPRILNDIPGLFETGLRRYLAVRLSGNAPDITFLDVAFDHAGTSALHLRVRAHVEGRCADQYEEIRREIQGVLVRICNEEHLKIPFNQLTVTLPGDGPLPAGSAPPGEPQT